jgi:hypothetical protein
MREILADGQLTRAEIGTRLSRYPALGDLSAGASGAGSDTLHKPLHWWGDICFCPPRGQETTFRLTPPDLRWETPDLEDAGPRAVRRIPGYDAWALGPGTADDLVVPPARRAVVTRGANLVLRGGPSSAPGAAGTAPSTSPASRSQGA